jgi:hypothetical protein
VNTIAIVGIIASILALATAATTVTLSNMVYADASTPNGNDPNLFGKGASDFGKNGEMGDHSKDGGAAGDHPYDSDDKKGRSGIGNIGNDLDATCGSKHPADLADVLNGNPC